MIERIDFQACARGLNLIETLSFCKGISIGVLLASLALIIMSAMNLRKGK